MRDLVNAVKSGNANETSALVRRLLSAGADPREVLDRGLLRAMKELGADFNNSEIFIAEVLNAAQAWNQGYAVLRDTVAPAGVELLGRVVIATVEGDIHDIGKNLVGMFLDAAGFEVIDLGVDVPAEAIVEAVRVYRPDILALSALLTVTMKRQELIIRALREAGLRDGLLVFVGGAPVTRAYCSEIGADFYETDAAMAAEYARKLFKRKIAV
jgi:5-methyltetrahydrofolate--homocysteine methyltransferase